MTVTFDPPPPLPPAPPPPGPPRFELPSWLRGRRPWWIALAVVLGLAALVAISAGVVLSSYVAGAPPIPDRDALWSVRRSPGMTFLDRNGHIIATRGAKYGQAVSLAGLPAYVPKAFLAAEDKRFYHHGAVDLYAIGRALWSNWRAHRSAEGASTLTQQLARTLFLKREDTLKRKVQEAYLASELEHQLSKDEVLELYLNRTYFGDGAYGVDAAAESYFGKPAARLSLIEAATLAGLPNAPSRLALTTNMPEALARAHRILKTMRTEGWITDAELAAASAQTPVLAAPVAHPSEGDEAYVIDQAAADALAATGGQEHDLIINTTIDPTLQTLGTQAVREVVLKEGARRHVTQGALVTLAPDGAILAMVGGLDHDRSAFNRVTQAKRQPGSSFKAFVFGAAVEHGLTESDVRDDAPIKIANWTPEDYEGGFEGKVTLQQALARSLNTVSVRLTMEVGPQTVADFARRLGVADIPPNPGPSIALGAYEVTPLELAGAYQAFQNGGGRTTPYLVTEVRSTRGDVLYAHTDSAPTPVLDPLYATRMVHMLKAVVTSGTGVGANIGRPEAGKTGTSQDWRDAWFVGFTPDLLTAVWVGNDDDTSMAKVTGGQLPAEIWKRFMTVAEAKLPPRDFPWLVNEPAQEPQPPPETVADDSGAPAEDLPPPDVGPAPERGYNDQGSPDRDVDRPAPPRNDDRPPWPIPGPDDHAPPPPPARPDSAADGAPPFG